ncbi:AraC family transcriptional regulator [Streptomyces hoynatensis]|uniref:AraC family transcriptional regulator n=1 Tax=Streptomyces hoynatensis TaxID=1141874 RepID=A0A3A9YMQ8_9ACTN|nr:AraC family transcriptional regulator [Streptomyces hoynatensis]RKN37521.1 AraC family transcriptional regulator [Streptomyces hoynatensis]
MDVLTELLQHSRAPGAAVARTWERPPWSVRCADGAPVSVHAVVAGGAWLLRDGERPRPLRPGDIAVVRGPGPHTLACAPPAAGPAPGAEGGTALVRGAYRHVEDAWPWLLESLPPVLVCSEPHGTGAVLDLLAAELERPESARPGVLARLLDLLFMIALRAWSDRSGEQRPRWQRVLQDPIVGNALRLLHGRPARQWTVQELAAAVGLSRSAFARRFHSLVGRPPIAYLTHWRMTLAARLLREPALGLDVIAHRVGYPDSHALSAAFKRVRGLTPHAYRARELGPPAKGG